MILTTRTRALLAGGVVAGAALVAAPGAEANDRHFTFTYETATLAAGSFELEPWTTLRIGRRYGYLGIDASLEFEVGITDRLQTAVYLHGFGLGSNETGTWRTESGFAGASSEWKYRILDQGLHGIGLAVYGEFTVTPDEVEAEARLLLDRRFGRFLLAANVVVAHQWVLTGDTPEREFELEVDVAGGWFFTPRFMLGLEVRSSNHWTLAPDVSHEDTTFFAGPTVAYSSRGYWLAASVMPQIGAAVGATGNDVRNLTSQEMVNARFLMGAHF